MIHPTCTRETAEDLLGPIAAMVIMFLRRLSPLNKSVAEDAAVSMDSEPNTSQKGGGTF
ncbi:hypothetical protein HDU98_002227 [Podochytrium sp. JEL0797]|nr:hypothetical protein HDU98_002227 [Podochytrium sp. JEL0797]